MILIGFSATAAANDRKFGAYAETVGLKMERNCEVRGERENENCTCNLLSFITLRGPRYPWTESEGKILV